MPAVITALAMIGLVAATDAVPSTPAITLAAFTKAMDAGDTATLATLSTGDAKEQAWLAAYSSHLKAFADLERAVAKRFGKDCAQEDAGVTITEQLESDRDDELSKDLKRAKLEEAGGDAVMIAFIEGASPDTQGRLVKVDGQWKVQIESLNNYFSTDDTAGLLAMTAAAAGLAKEIDDGKFATLDDAAKAVQGRLTAAEGVGAKKLQEPPGSKLLAKEKR
jgi:hypothetical protein